MSSIVSFLDNEDISLPPPKQPIYYAEKNYGTHRTAEDTVESANNMSIMVLKGRQPFSGLVPACACLYLCDCIAYKKLIFD